MSSASRQFALLAACSVAVAAAALQAQAQPAAGAGAAVFQATTLSLSAYGEVKVRPDMATVTLGVSTRGASAAEAMRANAQAMDGTLRALKAQGVAPADIQTSNLNLSPQYVYEDKQPPRLTGYEASNQVSVSVRDLARLGATLDAVVGAGANQVNGISFGIQESQGAENAARRQAVLALTAKAQLYAMATGYSVKRLVSLSEGGGYDAAPPMPMMAFAAAKRVASTPVEAGELKVRIDVNGLYELGR